MSKLYIHLPLSTDLSQRIGNIIETIRETDDRRPHAAELGHVLQQFTREAIQIFLFDVAHRIQLGKIGMKTVEIGGSTATKGFSMVINGLIKRLSDEQLLGVVDFLDEITIAG